MQGLLIELRSRRAMASLSTLRRRRAAAFRRLWRKRRIFLIVSFIIAVFGGSRGKLIELTPSRQGLKGKAWLR
jgi:hypothetical protein